MENEILQSKMLIMKYSSYKKKSLAEVQNLTIINKHLICFNKYIKLIVPITFSLHSRLNVTLQTNNTLPKAFTYTFNVLTYHKIFPRTLARNCTENKSYRTCEMLPCQAISLEGWG